MARQIGLSQATIARIFGVTRSCVSSWVRTGKVSTLENGRIDPDQAAGELLRLTGPHRTARKVLAGFIADTRGELERAWASTEAAKTAHRADLERLATIEPDSITSQAAREALGQLCRAGGTGQVRQ